MEDRSSTFVGWSLGGAMKGKWSGQCCLLSRLALNSHANDPHSSLGLPKTWKARLISRLQPALDTSEGEKKLSVCLGEKTWLGHFHSPYTGFLNKDATMGEYHPLSLDTGKMWSRETQRTEYSGAWSMPLIPALERQRPGDRCYFQTILIYIESSRAARTM